MDSKIDQAKRDEIDKIRKSKGLPSVAEALDALHSPRKRKTNDEREGDDD